jgi:peptide/nickel transport system permease protein
MTFLKNSPGTVAAFAAVAVLIIGGFAGVPLIWTLLVSFALIVIGATLVNGTYVLRRLLVVIPTVFLVTAFTFWLQNGRGDPRDLAFNILGPGATEAGVENIMEEFHLNEPLHERYMLWLSDALRGDLGRSAIQGQEVSTAIANAIPISLQLMLYSSIVALIIAVPMGVYAAYKANKRGDRIASTLALTGLSVPNYVLAVVMILFFALGGLSMFGTKVGGEWLPASRYVYFGDGPVEHFKHMALPTLALAFAQAATYMRVLRSDMISTLQENFITTAKAKGVPDRRILWGHALRPSSFTLLTVFGITIGTLVGGTLVVEAIFTLPGLGGVIGNAIFQKDFLVVQGVVVVIALGFIIFNFLVDLLYAVLDPRVRNVRA